MKKILFSIDNQLYSDFRNKCKNKGKTMSSVIRALIINYTYSEKSKIEKILNEIFGGDKDG